MNVSKQANELVQKALGHDHFRVKRAVSGWNYREEQLCEWLVLEVAGIAAQALVKMDTGEAKITWPDPEAMERAQEGARQLSFGIAEARNANERIRGFAPICPGETPRYIRRVFLFDTRTGVEYGFTREEWGEIEPFFSVKVC